MQRRFLYIVSIIVFSCCFFIVSCNKLDTTDIGSDLIPVVDNVNTFDTVLTVVSAQELFEDTTRIGRSEDHVLGRISNDPLFGTTDANIYVQLKPTFYPYYFGSANDTINPQLDPKTGFDSVVLCLNYRGFWGDSTIPQQITVKEVVDEDFRDSVLVTKKLSYKPTTGATLGSTIIDIRDLPKWQTFSGRKDSVRNQIRIKLSNAFANSIFNSDTTAPGGNFRTDSLFRKFLNGFAIEAGNMGNAIMYSNLADSTTKLEVYYRKKNKAGIDTTYSSFKLNTTPNGFNGNFSATANNVTRNRVGFPISNPGPDEIYLQTTPGTYANLSIPTLSTFGNRIIHRAELIIEQVPTDPLFDKVFSVPDYLYLDLRDTPAIPEKWKPIYFDLDPGTNYNPDNASFFFPANGVDFNYFGGFARNKTDQFSNAIKYYNVNITRYVQKIITTNIPNYSFRLFSPYSITYPQYNSGEFRYRNSLSFGRVKVGGGSHANYPMRLRIIYSKL
ncbi:MAG: DUF4270 family protein [Chitinophagaceae bacterium]|nr:DUF4270 family protein [Chitinophagaceae bacterium]